MFNKTATGAAFLESVFAAARVEMCFNGRRAQLIHLLRSISGLALDVLLPNLAHKKVPRGSNASLAQR